MSYQEGGKAQGIQSMSPRVKLAFDVSSGDVREPNIQTENKTVRIAMQSFEK
jgi:hypothetical protein